MTALLQKRKIPVPSQKKRPYKGSTLAPRTQEFVLSLCIILHTSLTGHPSKIMTWHSIPYPATHTALPWNAPSSFVHLGKSNTLRRPAEPLPPLGSPSDLQAGLDGLSSMTPMQCFSKCGPWISSINIQIPAPPPQTC